MLKSAAFAKHLAVITLESDVLDLDPIPRWVLYKKNIKRAALNVRDELLLADHRSHYAEEQLHMTIARMAWRQDVDLASRLLPPFTRRSAIASPSLMVRSGSWLLWPLPPSLALFGYSTSNGPRRS